MVMGTLKGFPTPPAMVRGEHSSPAPHAIRASGSPGLRFRSSHTPKYAPVRFSARRRHTLRLVGRVSEANLIRPRFP